MAVSISPPMVIAPRLFIEVKLAAARPLTAAEEDTARRFIGDGLGYAFALDFVYVDEIPREANGKYQDYRSEVSAATT